MGAAEARALWQRTASRCFAAHEDAKMAPMLACCHHQHDSPSSGNTEKSNLSSGSFDDFSCDTKWWLKGSPGFDEEITKSFFEDTKCKKLHEFVDLIGIGEGGEEEGYSFISKNASPETPWWRSTRDKDELAHLVVTKSVDHSIQNCDLPPPQKLHKRVHCTIGEKGFKTEVKSPWKQGVWGDRFERSLSYNSSTESKSTSPMSSPWKDDLSKAQLLEALRHSQTRAREAEKAAREARAEKDRVITILLRQASEMLAYKQWVKLLEMEATYLQMKKDEGEEVEEQIKGMNLKKRKQRGEKKKKKKMGEIGGYMMAFALGFSLIGAGLLLGWNVGWLFSF